MKDLTHYFSLSASSKGANDSSNSQDKNSSENAAKSSSSKHKSRSKVRDTSEKSFSDETPKRKRGRPRKSAANTSVSSESADTEGIEIIVLDDKKIKTNDTEVAVETYVGVRTPRKLVGPSPSQINDQEIVEVESSGSTNKKKQPKTQETSINECDHHNSESKVNSAELTSEFERSVDKDPLDDKIAVNQENASCLKLKIKTNGVNSLKRAGCQAGETVEIPHTRDAEARGVGRVRGRLKEEACEAKQANTKIFQNNLEVVDCKGTEGKGAETSNLSSPETFVQSTVSKSNDTSQKKLDDKNISKKEFSPNAFQLLMSKPRNQNKREESVDESPTVGKKSRSLSLKTLKRDETSKDEFVKTDNKEHKDRDGVPPTSPEKYRKNKPPTEVSSLKKLEVPDALSTAGESSKDNTNAFKLLMGKTNKVSAVDETLEKRTQDLDAKATKKNKFNDSNLNQSITELDSGKSSENLDDDFKLEKRVKKRKRIIDSDDEDDSGQEATPKQSKAAHSSVSLFSYFSPVTCDEARVMAAKQSSRNRVVAEVHQRPSEPGNTRTRRSFGPARRSQCRSNGEEDEIIVVCSEEVPTSGTPAKQAKPLNCKKAERNKTPRKSDKRRRPWKLKIKLLSPAKQLEEELSSESTGSDAESELELYDSPFKSPATKSAYNNKNLPLAPIFLPRNHNSGSTTNLSKVTRRIVDDAIIAPIRSVPVEHTIGFADFDPDVPLNTLCPLTSHVTQHAKTENIPESEKDIKLKFKVDGVVSPLHHPFPVGTFVEFKSAKISVNSQLVYNYSGNCQQQSWCDYYRPKTADEVVGNPSCVLQLRDWLDGWKNRSRAPEDKDGFSSDSESSDYSSGDDFIVDDDVGGKRRKNSKKNKKKKHCNTALLVGPCGSGKTAAVYAVADELGFKVLEMNASSRRSGKKMLSELQEATQSHQMRNSNEQDIHSFFTNSNKGKLKCKEQSNNGNNPGLSLILVEDVDVIFEEQDEGFLSALNVLAASSKRPLILVSNDPQCSLLLSRQHRLHLQFGQVSVTHSVEMMKKLCESEEPLETVHIKKLMDDCGGDIRRAVLLAQTWCLSGGFPKQIENCLKKPVDLEKLWHQMRQTSLPFIISQCDDPTSEDENDVPFLLDSTWNSGIASSGDEEEVINKIQQKKSVKRKRILSDTSMEVETVGKTVWQTDMKTTLKLLETFTTLDVLKGPEFGEVVSAPRPGLSDQPCMDSVEDTLGSDIQNWLAEKSINFFGISLLENCFEDLERWKEPHLSMDQDFLEQLPINMQLDRQSLALDILPSLRGIGRIVQVTTRKCRRSKLNALPSLGFNLAPLSIENLSYVFQETTNQE